MVCTFTQEVPSNCLGLLGRVGVDALVAERLGPCGYRHPADEPHIIAFDDRQRLSRFWWFEARVGDEPNQLVNPRRCRGL